MQKTETALTQAIKTFNDLSADAQKTGDGCEVEKNQDYQYGRRDAFAHAATFLISLLQKEREDMEEAYIDGKDEELTANRANREQRQSTQYFHDTFTQYKEHE